MVKIYFFAFLLFATSFALAYEVDQFTNRDKVPADDTTVILNMTIKQRLEESVQKSNTQLFGLFNVNCNSKKKEEQKEARRILFENLRSAFVSKTDVGLIEKEIMWDKNVDKRRVSVEQSIYNEAQNKNIILKGILSTYKLAPVISVNQVQIGTDKLGHFFNEGYALYLQNFSQSDENKRTYNTALFNKSTENDYNGLKTTGIKSYADLAANYEGYQFWNKLCGKVYESSSQSDKDYFEKHKCTKDAYIKCEIDPETKKGRWQLNPYQSFKIEDYVTEAWDESINCNSYTDAIKTEVLSALSRRVYTYKGDPKKPCPAEPNKCLDIYKRYGRSGLYHVISPQCKEIAMANKKTNPPEKKEEGLPQAKPSSSNKKSKTTR